MPTVSKKQERFMQAVAHNPKFAKKAGVPQSVGKDFLNADKGNLKRKTEMPLKLKEKSLDDMKKDAIYIGGHLSAMFGVFGKRFNNTNYNDYFKDKQISDITPYIITSIPEEEKPKNYEKIENGCYW